MYTLNLTHSQIHALSTALTATMSMADGDLANAFEDVSDFVRLTRGRRAGLRRLSIELASLHCDAVEVDGHGDELKQMEVTADDAIHIAKQRERLQELQASINELELQDAAERSRMDHEEYLRGQQQNDGGPNA